MPNSKPKYAEPITASELRVMANVLDDFLVVFRKAEAEALKQPNQALYTYGIASGNAGIKRLRTLVQQLEVSRFQASLGKPIQPNAKQNKRR